MRRIAPAAALAVALLAVPAAANVACYVDINGGKTITSTRVGNAFSGPATIAADGLQAGLGGGCDVIVPGILNGLVIGLLGRYDLQDVSTKFDGGSISSDAAWTAAARAGVRVNPGTLVYGLAGMSWTDISYSDATEISPRGYVYGAGLEIDIGVPNLSLYAEWNRTTWGTASNLNVTLKPASDTVRVGLKLKFGTADMPKVAH
jgi:opacity protein-like surface antigen